jgi:hypothetical protein
MNKLESYSRGLTWSMVFLLSALAAGCGGGGGGRDPILGAGGATTGTIIPGAVCTAAAGPTIPTVTMSNPTSGNQFVSTSTNGVANSGKLITATFSLDMDPATIDATSFTLTPVGGAALVPASVNYDVATKVATLTTSSALLADTSYIAVIRGAVKSAAGTPIACSYEWNFKTAAAAAGGPAPVVPLGRATSFGIASAAGITNTGTPNTRINGNAILHPTITCNAVELDYLGGFGLCDNKAPTIDGTVFSSRFSPAGGPTPAEVKDDLRAAYNSIMKANLPDATVLGCGTIGSGGGGGALVGCNGNSTLPPGVYISNTDSSIGVAGILTLDGQGDPNARFIFQMPSSTLTTAPGAAISLINGAKASNVFWQVGSSATLGTNSVFAGNVLADSSITMATGATSCGRLLAGAVTASGAFVFDSNVVSVPGHASAPADCK